MCILFIAIAQHPKYPLIICANRDEFHQRPSQKMHVWPDQKILAGKDLLAGGTWLGLTATGRFSALTNFRQPLNEQQHQAKKSRGELVVQALTGDNNTITNKLVTHSNQYSGFNLIYGDLAQLQCFNSINRGVHHLTPGIHSICNGALDDIWPKMALGQQQLIQVIRQQPTLMISRLLEIMRNTTQAPTEQLPSTGLSAEWEQKLSAIFITSADYGTRNTTIITQDNFGDINVFEQNYNAKGEITDAQSFNIAHTFKQINN